MSKLKIIAKMLKEVLSPLSANERRNIFDQLLTLIVSTEFKDVHRRANRQGNPLECPYGIFRSRADCTRHIEANHLDEFLKKYDGFKTPAYTERISQIKDNNKNRHYIYWAIYSMCIDKKYPDWNFLEVKDKTC